MRKRFTTKKTSKNATNPQAHLLGLPQELRDQIYDHVFDDVAISIRACKASNPTVSVHFACKQLYLETIERHYRSTTFYVEDTVVLIKWLRRLPTRHRKLIQDIRFGPGNFVRSMDRGDRANKAAMYKAADRQLKDHGISLQKGVLKVLVRTDHGGRGTWVEWTGTSNELVI